MVMVAAAAAAAKWFGSKRKGDGDGDDPGDSPIVRALFKAVNHGELDDLKGLVDKGCRVTLNSYDIVRNDDVLDRGPELFADAVSDMRKANPDVEWELYDELSHTDDGEHKIAVRFVSKSTVDGAMDELEVAAFGIVHDKKLTEWHQVADMDTYNARRQQTGEDAVGN